MLKWAVGQRHPTPGQQTSACYSSVTRLETKESSCFKTSTDRLYVARRRNNRGHVKKAAVRSIKRAKQDKENQPCCVINNKEFSFYYYYYYLLIVKANFFF